MAYIDNNTDNRLLSALAVVTMHAAVLYALLTAGGAAAVQLVTQDFAAISIAAEPPSPTPAAKRDSQPEAAAAPPNITSRAAAVVAPPAILSRPTPITAAPIPEIANGATAGSANVAGPGSGRAGVGDGMGSGGAGNGTGGGGAAKPRWVSGQILPKDYPRSARNANVGGLVLVHFTVGADGRTGGCTVKRSSGHPDLDATTCRLIEQRFRYEPARDRSGQPVAALTGWQQDWWLGDPR